LFFLAKTSIAQLYIEPLTGCQFDIGNEHHHFKMINSALQLSYKTGKHYELLLLLQKNWGLNSISSDPAFTTNNALPVSAEARKTIHPSSYSIAIGNRIRLNGANKRHVFSVLLFTGFNSQKISVDYNYDQKNYTILNPDETMKRNGPFVSGGCEYMRVFKNSRLLLQVNFASVPVGDKINYPNSFHYMVPLSLNVGYSFLIKNKHEK
jgi:hypothetical protein